MVNDQYQTKHNLIIPIYFKQRLADIEVANGYINMNIDRNGRVVSMGNRFVSDLAGKANRRTPSISSSDAIRRAAQQLGLSITELKLLSGSACPGSGLQWSWNLAGRYQS